jgi:formylglycine-generating enzyme required for sulfatase activity
MHGNGWEWCGDPWHPNDLGAPDDGRSWLDPNAHEQKKRLLRGGSWSEAARDCRSTYRDHARPVNADDCFGFRVLCPPLGPYPEAVTPQLA